MKRTVQLNVTNAKYSGVFDVRKHSSKNFYQCSLIQQCRDSISELQPPKGTHHIVARWVQRKHMSMPWVLVSLRLSLFMYTNVRNQQWGWSQAGSGVDEGMAMGVGRCEDRPRQVGGHRCMREWTHGGADSCMQETLMAAVEKWVADSEIKTWKAAGRKMGANSLLRTPRSRFRRRLQIETWKPFFSAMVSCRCWHHTDETVGMRKRSVFKIGGCVHSLYNSFWFCWAVFSYLPFPKAFSHAYLLEYCVHCCLGPPTFFYLHRTLLWNQVHN